METEEQITFVAQEVKKAGAAFLRGGAFKPRTSPYDFQGLGAEGIRLLLEAKKATGLPIVTELMDIRNLDLFEGGGRHPGGGPEHPELRHAQGTGQDQQAHPSQAGPGQDHQRELLMSAEYIMANGNENVILCERGIRTYETHLHPTPWTCRWCPS